MGRKRKDDSSATPLAGCKRRRPEQITGDWASLPVDIVQLITPRLLDGDAADYVAFRAVCSGWRGCTESMDLRSESWIALCDGNGVCPEDAREITLFHTGTARRLHVRLPGLRGYKIISFSAGLLVLVHNSSAKVRVLHPFTRVAVDFPSLAPVYKKAVYFREEAMRRKSFWAMKAAVCSRASSSSIVVVLWFAPVVVAAKVGSDHWEMLHKELFVSNTLLFQGRLYATKLGSFEIVQLYPPTRRAPPPGPPAVVAHAPDILGTPASCNVFLVESAGKMLLIIHHARNPAMMWWERPGFTIFAVHLHSNGHRKLRPMSNLGDRVLFLGEDGCMSVSADNLPSLSRNSIYFSDDWCPVLVHSLTTGREENLSVGCQIHDGKERIRPSVRPFTIADHLLTFCHLQEWTKGLMFHEYHIIPESFTELWENIKAKESQLRIPPIPRSASAKSKRKNQPTRR